MVTIDKKVGSDEVEDTRGGNELSKLFLVCLVEQRKEKTKERSKNSPYKWQTNKLSNIQYAVTKENLETNMH